MQSRCILVVGIHRSGTSAVAGILHNLGVYMGKPPDDIDPDFWYEGWPAYSTNPRAQFEDADVCAINRKLTGLNWRTPTPLAIFHEDGMGYVPALGIERKEMPLWGLKDPVLCFTAPVFIRGLQAADIDVGIIHVHRNFEASVDSLERRDDLPRPVVEHILAQYYLAQNDVRGRYNDVPNINITFPNLFMDTEKTVRETATWVFRDREPPSDEQIAKAVAHIDPGLNHHG
jgi:hypothetical protein